MKPLTIEELKSLEAGDWVWLVYKNTDYRRYAQIQAIEGTRLYVWGRGLAECEMKQHSDYGKTWLAYKNKEEAEAEEYKIYEEKSWGWMVSKYIPAHYKPWFTADTKAEVERRLAELKERKYEA